MATLVALAKSKPKKRPYFQVESSSSDGVNPKLFCLACKDWKPYATWGRHFTTYHKENDSQGVDKMEVDDNAAKGSLKAEPKRPSLKKAVPLLHRSM